MSGLLLGEDEEKILKHLNMDGDKLGHYMKLFSRWLATQKHLPQNFNDACRKKFLIWAKLDFEKAKKKFQGFCYNPITHKEFYRNRALRFEEDVNNAMGYIYMFPMPKLTPEGYRISLAKIIDGDNMDVLTMTRFFVTYLDFRIHKDVAVSGEVAVLDMKGLKPHHYAKFFNPTYMKFARLSIVKYPFIVKNIFVINCHPLLEKGVGLVKAVLPQKIADRMTILADPKDLNRYIPAGCLPEDYGGTERSLASFQIAWKEFWMELKDLYEELDGCKPIGAIPEEFKCYEDEYGVDGSFRMLNID